ncbi:MAG TPA: choice-of-anchor I family protein [Steroidobacteraceae bacterium]|nr:choice-of-anchor I family protein [Steroidobacteraceae bacterium]
MRHATVVSAVFIAAASQAFAAPQASLEVLGTYRTGVFDQGAAEIVAYDPLTRRVFVVNAAATSVDVLDIANPALPTLVSTIDAGALGDSANSVAVKNGLVAVAIQADVKTDPGVVAIYDSTSLKLLRTFPAGALPDMVAFSPDGKSILAANEGEPNADYSIDPEGSITYIDLSRGLAKAKAFQFGFRDFEHKREKILASGVRVFGPNASLAQDFEPEYITFSADSRFAWVTLQENNAIAKVDLGMWYITQILPLGTKDYAAAGNAFDPSDRDGGALIGNWPVRGLYLPDTIASYRVNGKTYLVTANEGDARDYSTFAEEARVKDLTLDPTVFPNRADLRKDPAIGRLNVTKTMGDIDGDGDYDALYAFGARSFSIWNEQGQQVFDSGSEFEDLIANVATPYFNSDHAESDSADSRSDNKGPEPEGLAVGEHNGRVYAFIGLERQSGIVVYDVTDPVAPVFQHYLNNRDFTVPTQLANGSTNPAAGDLGPEGLAFISAQDSPSGEPLLVVGNEISGTTTFYRLKFVD